MNDIPRQIKLELLRQKLQLWRNTHYSASLDAKVAQSIGDDAMLSQATAAMKRALQAQDVIEEAIKELADAGDES